ncbi:PDZ domain-containing protein [Leucobacter sp. cx-328]|uniref:YlbL family protein n=1 Tax=unclassified Leucobacter TaxID=2621730 RepID=UPI00165E29C4|nr:MULTISPECIES: S16 family serine protease [unclassified Leucobacter]MBC9944476.1 PDZ domain-containing protein [Leucobacter sp. cx-328]
MSQETTAVKRSWKKPSGTTVATMVIVLLMLVGFIPSGYAVERPGPVVNVLGEIELESGAVEVIESTDDGGFDTPGTLNLLTVSLIGTPERSASLFEIIPTFFDATQDRLPIDKVYPDNITGDERKELSAAMMESSQSTALIAAYAALGEEITVELRVHDVAKGEAAEGVLQAGDVLITAAGAPITSLDEFRALLTQRGAGNPVDIGIRRDGKMQTVSITPEQPADAEAPRIGVTLTQYADIPDTVKIHLEDIGGPSAGLVFALGVVDRLTEEPLFDGLNVSGTGTMSADGTVGAIGGLKQKMWAADRAGTDLFLMPIENCGQVPENVPSGLTVAPVGTLEEALSVVQEYQNGTKPAGLELCKAR